MDILVCVKQVPDDFAEIRLDPATGLPATGAVEKVANAFDTYALEMAVRWCEANGGEVSAAAIGPQSAESMLKNLLAVGAQKAFLFSDPSLEGGDEAAAAARLAQMVRRCEAENGRPYGLIFCGRESTDEISGQVGARLAELLGASFVADVVEFSPCGAGIQAKQETESGSVLYEASLPALFTAAKPGYDPRYPNIKSKMAARRAQIPVFDAQQAGIGPAESRAVCLGYLEPPRRAAGVKLKEKDAAEAVRKALERMANDRVL